MKFRTIFRNWWAPISLRSDRDWKALYNLEHLENVSLKTHTVHFKEIEREYQARIYELLEQVRCLEQELSALNEQRRLVKEQADAIWRQDAQILTLREELGQLYDQLHPQKTD